MPASGSSDDPSDDESGVEGSGGTDSADEHGNTDDEHSVDRDDGDRSFSLLRVVAGVGATALIGSYLLTWVTVVDAEGLSDPTISASDIYLFPEVVAALGVITLVIVFARWSRPAQLGVLLTGIISISISLLIWSFLNSNEVEITIGGRAGDPSRFEPAIGLLLALVASALLIASGFGGFIGSFDRWPNS
jgi:hypothetical protein